MLSLGNVTPKESYALGRPPRIISVGRQLRGKNPASLVRALAGLEGHLTLVGDGPCHGELESLVGELGLADRVRFHRSLPNEELCRRLPDFDIFAAHTDYWEIPKALLEPLLAGLPVVVNRRRGRPVPELQGDWVRLVEDTPGGYLEALRDLIEDHAAREGLGRRAARHAWRKYAPEKTEEAFVEIYRTILEQGDRAR
jgi:glycosyltransferase involved in cell wall biosynthesis